MTDIRRRIAGAGVVLLASAACGGDGGPSGPGGGEVQPPPGARAEFTAYPVDMTPNGTIEPLGHLAPAGHTIPTDHVYFYPIDYDQPFVTPDTVTRHVYAPATGAVSWMMQPVGTDWKVMFRVTNTFYYYLDHIRLRPGITIGTIVQAGEDIGTTNPGGAIDLGAYDLAVPALAGFANPGRYADQTLHCVNPFKYFVEPLRSALYARQRRVPTAAPDAPIDFDIPGKLIGNWFEQSVPQTMDASNGPIGWPKTLAFVYDNRDPSQVRISIGGTVSTQGIWTIDPDAPRPETVSVASGKVSYRLRYTQSTTVQSGLMIVQMLAPDQVKVEVFEGSLAGTAEFDSRAFIYIR